MYALRSWLEIKGQVTYMNAKYDNDFIAVYPEIYHGNETGAKTVVRYILNKPGVMATYGVQGPTTFDKTDHIFVFSKIFDTFGVDADHIMFLPILNLQLFKNKNKIRDKTCYFVGKGINLNYHPKDSILIDRSVAENQSALTDLLNECEVMYGYDPVSAMYEVARLCGCRVVLIQDQYTKEEWSKYEPGMNGISWGMEETIPLNVVKFRETYEELWWIMEEKIIKFIDITQR